MKKFLRWSKLHFLEMLLIIGTLSNMIWYSVMYPQDVSHIGLFLGNILLEMVLMIVLYYFWNGKGILFVMAQTFSPIVLTIFVSVYGLLFFYQSWSTTFGMLIIACVLFTVGFNIEGMLDDIKKHMQNKYQRKK